MGGPCENTDRHLWPQVSEPGAPHESLHITKNGALGINCGGYVYEKPIREWHKLAGGPFPAVPDAPVTSNERLTPEKLAEYRDLLPMGRFVGVGGDALKLLLDEIEACWAERKPVETKADQPPRAAWESMRAAIAREIDATKDSATRHRLIALHANSTLPAVEPCETTALRPGELEQLRRIDRAARALVDSPPGLEDRPRMALHEALFNGLLEEPRETTGCARCKEHEQFRHQHRDCDSLAVALQRIKLSAVSLADAQVIALEALRGPEEPVCAHPRFAQLTALGPQQCVKCGAVKASGEPYINPHPGGFEE